MRSSFKPLTTTLIGGVVFLLPLVVVLLVLGQGLALAAHAVQPAVALLPFQNVGGIAIVSIAALLLLLLICFGAGLVARAAAGRAFAERFEDRLQALYPRYSVIKAMSQGLHGALGKQVLHPVLLHGDEQQQVAFDIERLTDGRAVLYLPGAPDAWSGSVVVVAAERVEALAVDAADVAKAMQGMGLGLAALLQAAARRREDAPAGGGA
jgi:uncharacterized membrane protein